VLGGGDVSGLGYWGWGYWVGVDGVCVYVVVLVGV